MDGDQGLSGVELGDMRRMGMRGGGLGLGSTIALALLCLGLAAGPAAAAQVGPVSGLALPRFVSLKSDRVNLREGPSKDHRTAWVFQRAGLPVEIIAEFDNWRRIRDSEGSEGWVLHSLLSGRRTALVAPWRKGEVIPLMTQPGGGTVAANLQSGLVVNVRRCDKAWCRVSGREFDGFIDQKMLWGVYADERVE
jgi:SH3-like domain-containing protein